MPAYVLRSGAIMTPGQVRLLQHSFAAIEPIDADVAFGFYKKLFELAPDMRPFFIADIEQQWHGLMSVFEKLVRMELRSMLTLPVTQSANKEVSIPGITYLTERFVQCGVRPEHLPVAKEALLWTLEQHLGEEFDDHTHEAWCRACDMIAASMIQVMNAEAVEPALPDDHGRQLPEAARDSLELLFRK
jgi:nitric oxide dioxygenase